MAIFVNETHVEWLVNAGLRAPVARVCLDTLGGLGGVVRATSVELQRCGVSPKLAERLVAAFSIARACGAAEPRAVMGDPSAIDAAMRPKIAHLMQETFWMVALDVRNTMIDAVDVARGSLTSVEVHPREVFRAAIRVAAAGIVLVHNHPSGDPTPSADDIALTRRLKHDGDMIGIPVVDHVVIGSNGYRSIVEVCGAI